MVLAAQLISSTIEQEAQVVFLTDALSVLEAAANSKLPRLEEALKTIKCTQVVLQWIPSHCGIPGNEEADHLAKQGAGEEQEDNAVSLPEMKAIIKSLFRSCSTRDSCHQLTRPQQVTIFRLRTGHNRLNHHMHRRFRLAPSPSCPCGQAEQTTEHILQDCPELQDLRKEIWPQQSSLQDKLYGTVEALRKTTDFVTRSHLRV